MLAMAVAFGLSVLLRRWPDPAYPAAVLVGWVLLLDVPALGVGALWPLDRGLPLWVAVVLGATRRTPVGVWALAGVGIAWAVGRDLREWAVMAVIWLGLLVSMRAALRDTARGEVPAVLAVAGGVGGVLLALTGSVRLAQEAWVLAVPLLGIAGRPVSDSALPGVLLVLVTSWAWGWARSDLGAWIAVPVLLLQALWFVRRWGWGAVALAVAVGGLGVALVLRDWLEHPPF